jgi:hypothetical protein
MTTRKPRPARLAVPCDPLPPLVMGGQGRTASEVRASAAWCAWCAACAVVLVLALALAELLA